MTMQTSAERPPMAASRFGDKLRSWRQHRNISQLELALNASVSQRHVSWLETGRSRPSRQMVVQLADALDIPLRQRNLLLDSAGYAPLYAETAVEAIRMTPVLDALSRILQQHDPLPAIVIDRLWRVRMTNASADRLLGLLGGDALWAAIGDTGERSLARLTLHPEGLRPLLSNWQQAIPAFLLRLRREAQASGSTAEQREYETLLSLIDETDQQVTEPEADLLPVLPLTLAVGELELNLFSVISTFGTPQDITVDELRIESFFPADQPTHEFFEQLAARAPRSNNS